MTTSSPAASGSETNAPEAAREIVAFWREAGPDRWFKRDDAFDAEIRERFAVLHAAAAAGRHDDWADSPEGALALLLLLDQFSRNLHRGQPATYAHDEQARAIASRAVARGFDRDVEPGLRKFFYMPFMHSEALADQELCVRLCHGLYDLDTLKWARHHAEIIRRFGRFPHRNAILGRHTTPAERAFLEEGGFGA
ncbi:MAG TPA: DUF924 family protein [Afifellaceae bacterium]|nr:DUF924 family protein [Afifellaceae bacterium]